MGKKKKTVAKTNLNVIYNEVARKADIDGVHINVAETKRVMACFFDVLEDYPPSVGFSIISKGLQRAGKRSR